MKSRCQQQKKIFEAGQAIVFKASYNVVDICSFYVAVKVFKNQQEDDAAKQAYIQEVSKLEKLKHKNILPIVRFYHYQMILVTPWMENESLHKQKTKVYKNPKLMLTIFTEIAEALAFMHSNKVMHLDIKPTNVLLDTNFKAYVADFGLAYDKKQADANQMSLVHLRGTQGYFAPELKTSEGNMKSDVYSFGMLMYNVITGKNPDQDNYIKELDKKIADANEDPNKQAMLILLKELIKKCVQNNSARPDSNALVLELKQIFHVYTANASQVQQQQRNNNIALLLI